MTNLTQAIQTAFNGNSDLMGIFTDGLWLGAAPDQSGGNGPKLPVCVMVTIKPVTHYDTSPSTYWEQTQIQFSVFALDDVTAFDALEALKSLFANSRIAMPGGAICLEGRYMGDWIEKADEKVWRGYCLFEFKVEQSIG